MRPLRVLTWHIHGSYLYYLAHSHQEFYLPVKPGRPVGYCGRTLPDTLHTRLRQAPAGTTGPTGDTAAVVTAAFVSVLRTIAAQIEVLAARIAEQLDRHPDLHQLVPLRLRTRRPTAHRDRRRPRPLPHRRFAGLPRRGRLLHPPVRQSPCRHLPLGRR